MRPVVVSTEGPLRQAVAAARRAGKPIGFVPTMGALHAGHVSLIETARAANDFVVVSIFVNPTQFGPQRGLHSLSPSAGARPGFMRRRGCGVHSRRRDDVPTWLPDVRSGSRPLRLSSKAPRARDIFAGVATVVLKLFNLVQPDRAYFGQKDAQQVRVLQQMVSDLNVPVEVVVCPTVREPDGLALSSRNQYLDADQRREASR